MNTLFKPGAEVRLLETSIMVTTLNSDTVYKIKKYDERHYFTDRPKKSIQLVHNPRWYRIHHFELVDQNKSVALIPLIDRAAKVVVCVGHQNYKEFKTLEDAKEFISKGLKEKPTREYAIYKLSSTAKVQDFPVIWDTV